jgi:hypothetical protein
VRQRFPEHDAEREHVGPAITRAAAQLLGGGIARRARAGGELDAAIRRHVDRRSRDRAERLAAALRRVHRVSDQADDARAAQLVEATRGIDHRLE